MAPSDGSAAHSQAHPLYATDRELVDGLLAAQQPSDGQLTELARLLNRYDGFPGAEDLQDDLSKTLRLWGLSLEDLQRRTRAIWAQGYRPGAVVGAEAVGSGFDTSSTEG